MAAMDLLQPTAYGPPAESMRVSQQAPAFLSASRPSILPYPLSMLSNSESQEKWQAFENLLVACLRTGDDETAYVCLRELTERFGEDNARVQALGGLYREATAKDDNELRLVLKSYDDVLAEVPTNMPIQKRRVALLRSMGNTAAAMAALTRLLDSSPIDAEAWAELADLYFTQSNYSQAIFCMEEVLLVTPNAWNMHARLGEVTYVAANVSEDSAEQLRLLSNALRHFCRSIELCDDYLRGYYGLALTASRLLPLLEKPTKQIKSSTTDTSSLPVPSTSSVQRLREKATAKLAEIVRRASAGEKGWDGYDKAEVGAARDLLQRTTQAVQQ